MPSTDIEVELSRRVSKLVEQMDYTFEEPFELELEHLVIFDSEGFPFSRGNSFPFPVCYQFVVIGKELQQKFELFQESNSEYCVLGYKSLLGLDFTYLVIKHCVEMYKPVIGFMQELQEEGFTLSGFNLAYDMGGIFNAIPHLTPTIFKFYKEHQAVCVAIREYLYAIATDNFRYDRRMKLKEPFYSLGMLVNHYLKIAVDGKSVEKDKNKLLPPDEETIRVNFWTLQDIPITAWPEEALEYAIDDVLYTFLVFRAQSDRRQLESQSGYIIHQNNVYVDSYRQSRKAFGLNIVCGSGMYRSKRRSIDFINTSCSAFREAKAFGSLLGFVRGKENAFSYPKLKAGLSAFGIDLTDPAVQDSLGLFKAMEFDIRTMQVETAGFSAPGKEGTQVDKILQFIIKTMVTFKQGVLTLTDSAIAKFGDELPLVTNKSLQLSDIATSADSLNKTGCPILMHYAKLAKAIKLFNAFAPILLQTASDKVVVSSSKPMLRNARISVNDPNFTQLPRESEYRSCWQGIPTLSYYLDEKQLIHFEVVENTCLNSTDYEINEMKCLANILKWRFGQSQMADVINEGKDPHKVLGADLEELPYEEFVERFEGKHGQKYQKEAKNARQFAKVGDFGRMGGMGAKAFVEYAYGYGLVVSEERAQEIIDKFDNRFSEIRDYFKWNSGITGKRGSKEIRHYLSNRVNGGLIFTSACNNWFSGLAGDGGGHCLFELVARSKVYHPDTPAIFGTKVLTWIHDESITCGPDYDDSWVKDVEDIQVAAMQVWTPYVKTTAEGCMMKYMSKSAKPVYNNGRMVPWVP